MTRTDNKFTCVARAGEATGITTLRLPWLDLWNAAEREFAVQVVQECCLGLKLRDPQDLIDQARLSGEAQSLFEWLGDYRTGPRLSRFDSAAGLVALAAQAEDFARDDGQWHEFIVELEVPTKQAIAESRQRLTQLRDVAMQRFGIDAAEELLKIFCRQLTATRGECEPPPPWSPRRAEELRRWAQQLRSWSQPRSRMLMLLRRLRPSLSPRHWQSAIERNAIERQIVPGVARAQSARIDQLIFKCQQKVWDAVLGRAGIPGIIDELLSGLQYQRRMVEELMNPPTETPLCTRVGAPHTVLLVQSLDTLLADRRRTVGDLYRDAIERAGCSATDLAAKLQQHGLEIEGRQYVPSQWHQLSLPAVRNAFHDVIQNYLGSQDRNAPLDTVHPTTAFEHAAGITLLHPELRHLLLPAIVAWARQSKPFAEFQPIPDHAPNLHTYLFCYESDRRQLEELLVHHVSLSNGGTEAAAEKMAFATRHPYVAVLLRHTLAAPCGALKNLPHYVHLENLNRRTGRFPPIIDRNAYPELRLLAIKRPGTIDDARDLLSAAIKAHVVHPIAGTQSASFTLGRCPRHLERIFAPRVPVAEWRTASFFKDHLADASLVQFVEHYCTNHAIFRRNVELLAREHDADIAVEKLVEWGIAEPGPSGHYRLILRDGMAAANIPESFTTNAPGPLIGLSEADFAGVMNGNQDLYNAIFWPVCDAVEIGVISPSDAPEFMQSFLQSLC